jgi:antitoxin component YwqK of YwqJK toxin-antitoxin module
MKTIQTEYMKLIKNSVRLLMITIVITLTACQNQQDINQSIIEVKMFDSDLLNKIRGNYDSLRIEIKDRGDFRTIEYYAVGDSIENKILKDSNGAIVGISMRLNKRSVFAEEYYPNGQSKGSIVFDKQGEIDGAVKYYYSNGQIRALGAYRNGQEVGLWYGYDSMGKLVEVESY